MKLRGLKLYEHRKNGSIILLGNRPWGLEILGKSKSKPTLSNIEVFRSDWKLSKDRVILKTSKTYSKEKSWIIFEKYFIFFHEKGSDFCAYIDNRYLKDGSEVVINRCHYDEFTGYLSRLDYVEIHQEVLEFKNKFKKPKDRKDKSKHWQKTVGSWIMESI